MENLALIRIQKMKPYTPPLNGRLAYEGLLLDFNERTQPPPSKVALALEEFIKSQKFQMYPEYFGLEKKLADYAGVNEDQIMITNGSDQGIDIVFRTFTEKGDKVIIPAPSFTMFFQCAQIVGNEVVKPLYRKDDLTFPFEEALAEIDEQTKLIVLCNPNNPTGTTISIDNIEKIVRKAKEAIVYVDEAYFEFSKITAISLMKKYTNIIITRTLSKSFGLASLRIGYVIAKPEHIAEMMKIRGPYDVNIVAYYAAHAALENREGMENYVKDVMWDAKPLVEKFFDENTIPYFPSRANFILFRPNDAENVMNTLSANGVLVRPQNKQNIENTLRVSIGTINQMKKFIDIYKNSVLKKSTRKFAFLDRDGTLIFEPQDNFQIDSLAKLKILDGVIKGLKKLKSMDYSLIMVSNQDGLGTPLFAQENFDVPQEKMLAIFRKNGIIFDEVLICPHFSNEACNCRKPKTGLVEEFLRTAKVNKTASFVCGDRNSDRQFAQNVGLRFIPMQTNGDFYEAIKLLLTKTI